MTLGQSSTNHQQPPFSVDVLDTAHQSREDDPSSSQAAPPLESLLPASFRNHDNELEPARLSLEYLGAELGLQRLEGFNHWFWLLSSPQLPPPLHDCAFLGRHICVTENMDRHLGLGKHNHLYLKPVPRVLLDLRFWRDFLPCDDACHGPVASSSSSSSSSPSPSTAAASPPPTPKCAKRQLWECALGFLFSYAALISHESDFRIAAAHGLLPAEVTWARWRALARQVAAYPGVRDRVHARFLYGELRLQRLEEMSQLRRGSVVRVLAGRLDRVARFFQTNARWLASLVAYLAIVLTALQTGLATEALAASAAFQAFSSGFAVFSLVGPLGVVLGFGLYFGLYVSYYLVMNLYAARNQERLRRKRRRKFYGA